MLLSNPQRIPLELPFAEMEGTGAAKLNSCEDLEVGDVDIKPLPLALKENAFRLSGPA